MIGSGFRVIGPVATTTKIGANEATTTKIGVNGAAATRIAIHEAYERWWSARGTSTTTIVAEAAATGVMATTDRASTVAPRAPPGAATEQPGQARS